MSITVPRLGASIAILFGNYFYHHKQQIRVMLDMDPLPTAPTMATDPPEYKPDPQFEQKLDKIAQEIEAHAAKKTSVDIGDQLEYKGDYTKKNKQVYPNGKGVYSAKNNQFKMVGTFTDGVVNGPAVFRYPDGSIVKTEFKDGEIKGYGIRILDEMRFEGNLLDGRPNGSGQYTFDDRKTIYVKEADGIETAQCYDEDGRMWYRGEYSNGQCEGFGEFFYKNGNRYIGNFKKGKMDGVGTLKNKYGDVLYDGVFNEDAVVKRWKLYTEPGIVAAVILVNAIGFFKKV